MLKRTKKEIRKNTVMKRKNFLGTLMVSGLLWLSILILIYFFSPEGILPKIIFFVLTSLALMVTFSTLFENKRRGLLITSAIIFFLMLRMLGVGNLFNLFLVIAIA